MHTVTEGLFDMPAVVPTKVVVPTHDGPAVAVYPLVPTRSFDAPLTYALPQELVGSVVVGTIVEVPLGNAARVGVVSAVDVEPPPNVRLKPVGRVVDQPAVPAPLIELAEWVADQYGCARTIALALVVGPRLAASARATAVPHRKRQQAVRRIVDDLDGLDLSRRQRAIATEIPTAWIALAALASSLGTTRSTFGKLAEAGVVAIEDRYLDELAVAAEAEAVPSQDEPKVEGFLPFALTPLQLTAVDICSGDADGTAEDPTT
ncbi:MAG: PriA, partial [Thermoleophilia bacterium]|nr:PriA [Thermoleophilia bacterium]